MRASFSSVALVLYIFGFGLSVRGAPVGSGLATTAPQARFSRPSEGHAANDDFGYKSTYLPQDVEGRNIEEMLEQRAVLDGLLASAKSFAARIASKPPQVVKKTFVLYSGGTGPVRALNVAQEIASQKNAITIDSAIKAFGLNSDGWTREKEWPTMSKLFVEAMEPTSRKAIVILGKEHVSAGNVFHSIEWPALQANKNVQEVDAYVLVVEGGKHKLESLGEMKKSGRGVSGVMKAIEALRQTPKAGATDNQHATGGSKTSDKVGKTSDGAAGKARGGGAKGRSKSLR